MKFNYSKKMFLFLFGLGFCSNAFSQIIENGTYQIFNSVHSEVITTDTTAPYEAKMGEQDHLDNFQLWTFTHQGNDIYKIQNSGSNTTLGINDGWCGQFGDVRAGFAETDLNVEFKVVAADAENTYVFQIAFTTCNFGSVNDPIKAFDIQDGASGAQIQTFDVNFENPNQQFQIVVPGSLNNQSFENANHLTVYYDQTKRSVHIKSNEILNQIEIYNMNGSVVKSFNNGTLKEMDIDFSAIANGLYFIKYQNSGVNHATKIMIF